MHVERQRADEGRSHLRAFQLAAGFSSLNESAVAVVRRLEVVDSSSSLCGK